MAAPTAPIWGGSGGSSVTAAASITPSATASATSTAAAAIAAPPPAATPTISVPYTLKRKRSILDAHEGGGAADSSPYSDADLEGLHPPASHRKVPLKPPTTRRKKFKDDGVRRCTRCERRTFTENDKLITCPRCGWDWHMGCTHPSLLSVWRADPGRFRCSACEEDARQLELWNRSKNEALMLRRAAELARMKTKALEALPVGVYFEKPGMIGFGAGTVAAAAAGGSDGAVRSPFNFLTFFLFYLFPSLRVCMWLCAGRAEAR